MSARRGGLGIGLLAAATMALAGASPAFAAIQCGDVITKDIKLKKNLNCSGGGSDGLEIGKNGVEVDLNGKTLRGPAGSYNGIENGGGYDGLIVKNGTLKGWDNALYNYQGSRPRFTNLDIELGNDNNNYGIYMYYAIRPVIKNVTIENAAYGIYGYANYEQRIEQVKVTGSDDDATHGLYDSYSSGVIEKFKANGAYLGLYVSGVTSRYLLRDSTANNTGYAGFYISNSTPFQDYRYTLRDNTANDADTYGFYASSDVDGGGNKAKGAGSDNCYNVPCGN